MSDKKFGIILLFVGLIILFVTGSSYYTVSKEIKQTEILLPEDYKEKAKDSTYEIQDSDKEIIKKYEVKKGHRVASMSCFFLGLLFVVMGLLTRKGRL